MMMVAVVFGECNTNLLALYSIFFANMGVGCFEQASYLLMKPFHSV
jgi:hypothetical protein